MLLRFSLGIVEKILYVRSSQKDWYGNPNLIGERPNVSLTVLFFHH
ncbi:MAG: hypothetical protein L3J74_15760 [Bacteroidales bacterium]|nr:hypothetical protein [Bacteroidales bacterium]